MTTDMQRDTQTGRWVKPWGNNSIVNQFGLDPEVYVSERRWVSPLSKALAVAVLGAMFEQRLSVKALAQRCDLEQHAVQRILGGSSPAPGRMQTWTKLFNELGLEVTRVERRG